VSAVFQPIASRPAPIKTEGFVPWLKRNLFGNWKSTLTTVVMVALFVYWLPGLFNWAIVQAIFQPNAEVCQAARGSGACWGVIAEKHRLIIFGYYPYEEQWRPQVATLLLVGLLVVSCIRTFWRPWLGAIWVVALVVFFWLMYGGALGLSTVQTDRWGGLPLTIELIRGVPLISVLFMASFMFPLFMPPGLSIDVLIRVLVGITLFAAAYMAEIVRGGLQAIPKGQVEAAQSLGLSYWQTQRKIVLPQALAMVVPGIMNNFISIFKDTSLVTIVSLYELTGALGLALNSDADWRPFKIEGYLFITAIYFVFCFAMSRYSLWIEKRLNVSKTRSRLQ
jgi:general L-amino acid transport system permease protein